jgi:hypothetical protein
MRKTIKSIISMLLLLAMIITMASCKKKKNEECNHMDANFDGVCDYCAISMGIKPEDKPVDTKKSNSDIINAFFDDPTTLVFNELKSNFVADNFTTDGTLTELISSGIVDIGNNELLNLLNNRMYVQDGLIKSVNDKGDVYVGYTDCGIYMITDNRGRYEYTYMPYDLSSQDLNVRDLAESEVTYNSFDKYYYASDSFSAELLDGVVDKIPAETMFGNKSFDKEDLTYQAKFKIENEAVVGFVFKITETKNEVSTDIFVVKYEEGTAASAMTVTLNQSIRISVDIVLDKVSDTEYDFNTKWLLSTEELFGQDIDMETHLSVQTSNDQLFEVTNELLAAITHAKTQLSAMSTLAEQYEGNYESTEYCDRVAIYNSDYNVYVIMTFDPYEEVYKFDSFKSSFDLEKECLAHINTHYNTIVVASHSMSCESELS